MNLDIDESRLITMRKHFQDWNPPLTDSQLVQLAMASYCDTIEWKSKRTILDERKKEITHHKH